MANPTVRYFPIFYKGQKVGEAHDNTYRIDTGRSALFGSEGYYSHSKGAARFSLTSRTVVPVSGMKIKVVEDALAQNDVEIGIPVNGKFHKVTAAITNVELTANSETGRCEGTITFEGGVPDLT